MKNKTTMKLPMTSIHHKSSPFFNDENEQENTILNFNHPVDSCSQDFRLPTRQPPQSLSPPQQQRKSLFNSSLCITITISFLLLLGLFAIISFLSLQYAFSFHSPLSLKFSSNSNILSSLIQQHIHRPLFSISPTSNDAGTTTVTSQQENDAWEDGERIGDFSGLNLTYGHYFQRLYIQNSKRKSTAHWHFGNCPIPQQISSGIESSNLQISSFASLNVINRSSLVIDYLLYPSGHLAEHHHHHTEWRFGKILLTDIFSLQDVIRQREDKKKSPSPALLASNDHHTQTVMNQVTDIDSDSILKYIFLGTLEFFVSNTSEKEGIPTSDFTKLYSLTPVCFYFNQFQWSENIFIPGYPYSAGNTVLSIQVNPNMSCADILRRKAFCNETSNVFVFESPGSWTGFLLLLVVLGGIAMVFSIIGGIALAVFAVSWFAWKVYKKYDLNKKKVTSVGSLDRHDDSHGDDFGDRRRLLHGDLDIDDHAHVETPPQEISRRSSLSRQQNTNMEGPNNLRSQSRVNLTSPSPVVTTAEAAHLLGITGRKHFRFFQ
ncbi:hypothetical protein FDP41_010991 [Naegleria fowleri]|uniref:Uncharacterized protein n=1 Tax=Naegleria fowleri TaxID=5763 RepID=A0A6A5BY21_NAEFO|nr:uncharacterized protein FDP41_010991 [Naegleria fowleri]KAF0983013.1 hypothetical protein FDP41_010991 [Naegleria fowleri]